MSKPKTKYSRKELIDICEKSIVAVDRWLDRDTPGAQGSVGECWAYLKADCPFTILTAETEDTCITDTHTIWLKIQHPTFGTFDWGQEWLESLFYLPTPKRLRENIGKDWY